MKFSALTLLALGVSATAYVVNDKKVVTDNAVEARLVGSGPVRAAALVAAMQARDPEPHHKGKGRKGNNKREVEIEARHHKGKGGKGGKAGKAAKGNNKREVEADDEIDDDEDDELTKREPHHKGKGGKAGRAAKAAKGNNKREVEIEAREVEIEAREPHHKGKGGKAGKLAKAAKAAKGNNKRQEEAFDQAADDAHWADLHTREPEAEIEAREPHHKGKGGKAGKLAKAAKAAKGNNKRQEEVFDQAADDAHWADLHTREPHHKGKGRKGN